MADGASLVCSVESTRWPVKRRLDRHVGGLQVADFAHHDDVGVLAHQRAQAVGEIEVDAVLHLHLVERRLHHFDRVFDGADVDLGRGQLLSVEYKRGGLARAGGPGDQDDAVRRCGHLVPARRILVGETEFGEIA